MYEKNTNAHNHRSGLGPLPAKANRIAYPKTIDKLIRQFPNAKIVVPGYGDFGGVELIKHTRELSTKPHEKN
ncbi:MAG: hypothetical protein M0Q53_20230 [Prolixibacteraceae bacterium]|jgi:metallo-beta-lactamase class B|nr:hypothetical protein [Prolixibacteraceae bacterium]